MTITFTPLTREHLPLMLTWLQAPHVKQWWDRHMNWTIEKVEQKFGTYCEGFKVVDGGKRPIYAFVIELDSKPIGTGPTLTCHQEQNAEMNSSLLPVEKAERVTVIPIGYIQCYDLRDFAHPDLPYNILPQKCAGLDLFIGEIESIGRGVGTQILQQFLTEQVDPLFNGCVIDPVSDNLRAIKAFEKAGFKTFQEVSNITWMKKNRDQ